LGTSPFEIVSNYNYFDVNEKKSENNTKMLNERVKAIGMKTNDLLNKKRKTEFKYVKDSYVCIKRENSKGLESIWLGPYRVKEVSNCGNRVKLIDWGDEWLNIKRLKPFKRG
jgi:hypothetical protein